MDEQLGRLAVLAPLIAEAGRVLDAGRVALIDVGRPAGLNLTVDLARIRYSTGTDLGPIDAPMEISAEVVRGAGPPATPLPRVTARFLLARTPLDLADAAARRTVVGAAAPGHGSQTERQVSVLRGLDVVRVPGDPIANLAAVLRQIPRGTAPIIMTSWTVSAMTPPRRLALRSVLEATAGDRALAWVSAEGVGVAPSIPTFGDRPASGHSILGLAATPMGASSNAAGPLRYAAFGRCWQRGARLSWLGRTEQT